MSLTFTFISEKSGATAVIMIAAKKIMTFFKFISTITA